MTLIKTLVVPFFFENNEGFLSATSVPGACKSLLSGEDIEAAREHYAYLTKRLKCCRDGNLGRLKHRRVCFQAQQELRKLRKIHIPSHAHPYLLPEAKILYYAIIVINEWEKLNNRRPLNATLSLTDPTWHRGTKNYLGRFLDLFPLHKRIKTGHTVWESLRKTPLVSRCRYIMKLYCRYFPYPN